MSPFLRCLKDNFFFDICLRTAFFDICFKDNFSGMCCTLTLQLIDLFKSSSRYLSTVFVCKILFCFLDHRIVIQRPDSTCSNLFITQYNVEMHEWNLLSRFALEDARSCECDPGRCSVITFCSNLLGRTRIASTQFELTADQKGASNFTSQSQATSLRSPRRIEHLTRIVFAEGGAGKAAWEIDFTFSLMQGNLDRVG